LLYVFDEAKIIPAGVWESAEGALASGDCYALATSTPGAPSGRFYDIHNRKRGTEDWVTLHVTRDDAIAAGRMSLEWAEKRKLEWGESSAVYQNRVEGNFAIDDATVVIPLSWVEAANERWWALHEAAGGGRELGNDESNPAAWGHLDCLSVDVARFGSNDTAIGRRYGWAIRDIQSFSKRSTMNTVGIVIEMFHQALNGGDPPYIVVDSVGVGGGVFDRLQEQGYPVLAFVAGARASDDIRPDADPLLQKRFVNLRSQAWWGLRTLLDPDSGSQIALPPDDPNDEHSTLTSELVAPTWSLDSAGRIRVESKDDINARLGHSTDRADVVVQSFWTPPPRDVSELQVYSDPAEISPY
jgi:hypothetical protein